MTQALRSTIDRWGLRKLKSFCKAKDTVERKKMAAFRLRKDLYQPYIQQRTDIQNI